jgi:hypothetical protein
MGETLNFVKEIFLLVYIDFSSRGTLCKGAEELLCISFDFVTFSRKFVGYVT